MAEFFDGYGTAGQAAWMVIKIVVILAPLLLAVAYLTYVERKVIGAMQLRRCPNVVGPWGLLQPIADGLKLMFKETVVPAGANPVVFIAAPMAMFLERWFSPEGPAAREPASLESESGYL